MKKIILCFVVGVLGCIASFSSLAFEPMNIPPMADFVVDYAGVLSPSDVTALTQQAAALQEATTAQVASLIIPSKGDYQLVDIGLKVFRETGLGKKASNNGVLLVISAQDKKIRIVVGYGLEGDIPDIVARDILESDIRPRINSGDYVGGISAYMHAISQRIQTPSQQSSQPQNQSINWLHVLVFVVWVVIFFTLMQCIDQKNKAKKYGNKHVIKPYPVYDYLIFFAKQQGVNIDVNFLYGILFVVSIGLGLILPHMGFTLGTPMLLGTFTGNFLGVMAFGERVSSGGSWGGGGRSSGGGGRGGGGGFGGFSGGGGSSGGGGAGD